MAGGEGHTAQLHNSKFNLALVINAIMFGLQLLLALKVAITTNELLSLCF